MYKCFKYLYYVNFYITFLYLQKCNFYPQNHFLIPAAVTNPPLAPVSRRGGIFMMNVHWSRTSEDQVEKFEIVE